MLPSRVRHLFALLAAALLTTGLLGASPADAAAGTASVTFTLTAPDGSRPIGLGDPYVSLQRLVGGAWTSESGLTFENAYEGTQPVSDTFDELEAGTYRLRIALSDWVDEEQEASQVSYSATFTLTPGQHRTMNVPLPDYASVAGQVTVPVGASLPEDGTIVAVSESVGGEWSQVAYRYLNDDESAFVFGGLGAGTYRLEAYPQKGPLVRGISAEFTLVAGQNRTATPVALGLGAGVAGTFTGPGGSVPTGLTGLSVSVERKEGTTWSGYWTDSLVRKVASDRRSFTVTGLEAGTYRLVANPKGGRFVKTRSAEFTVTTGEAKTGFAVALDLGGVVRGRLRGPGGGALPGDAGTGLEVTLETRRTDGSWRDQYTTEAAADGSFELIVPQEATYRVSFASWSSQDSRYWAAPTDPQVWSRTTDVSGVDLILRPSAVVSGTLGLDGVTLDDPNAEWPSSVSVDVLRVADGEVEWLGWTSVQAAGPFSVHVPDDVSGNVILSITRHEDFADDYAPVFWNGTTYGTPFQSAATAFSLSAGQVVTGKDVTLRPTVTISGSLAGAAGDGDVQVLSPSGEVVSAYPRLTWGDDDEAASPTGYSFAGLAAGSYTVAFERATGLTRNAAQYYDGVNEARGIGAASTIALAPGATRANVNATLQVGGSITGRVVQSDGSGAAYCWMDAYDPSGVRITRSAITDEDGAFDIGGLSTGGYRVKLEADSCLDDGEDRYVDLDRSTYLNRDESDGDAVSVTLGAPTALPGCST